jgi:hypothetical protein
MSGTYSLLPNETLLSPLFWRHTRFPLYSQPPPLRDSLSFPLPGTYQVIAQLCADTAISVTAVPEATFHATSGGGNWPWGSNGDWGSGGMASMARSAGAEGDWAPWSSSGAWPSGPWTAWWSENGMGPGRCPDSNWDGWTSGSWSTDLPWTSWKSCTCYTTATSTVMSTSAGYPVTSVTYGYQVADATAAVSVVGATRNAASKRKTPTASSLIVAGLAAVGLF